MPSKSISYPSKTTSNSQASNPQADSEEESEDKDILNEKISNERNILQGHFDEKKEQSWSQGQSSET